MHGALQRIHHDKESIQLVENKIYWGIKYLLTCIIYHRKKISYIVRHYRRSIHEGASIPWSIHSTFFALFLLCSMHGCPFAIARGSRLGWKQREGEKKRSCDQIHIITCHASVRKMSLGVVLLSLLYQKYRPLHNEGELDQFGPFGTYGCLLILIAACQAKLYHHLFYLKGNKGHSTWVLLQSNELKIGLCMISFWYSQKSNDCSVNLCISSSHSLFAIYIYIYIWEYENGFPATWCRKCFCTMLHLDH